MKMIIYSLLLASMSASCGTVKSPKQPNKVNIRTTAYHCGESDHLKYKNRSATGAILKKNKSIAADWSVFPVETQLKIEGIVYEVEDYGSALIQSPTHIPVIDVFQPNKREMDRWGVRFFNDVKVVKWGSFERSAEILKDRLKYAHCRVMYNRIQQNL